MEDKKLSIKHLLRSVSKDSLTSSGSPASHGAWKPITLKPPFHIAVVLLCVFFVTLIEILLSRSNRDGGLLFADATTGQLPAYALFCFEYLPTLLSVLHSLLWVSIDHDIKRLEPFFHLSKPGGALAQESLLLDYPFQFAFFVPWVAFRNRHWTVFLTGIITLLAIFVATPLMSAVLTQEDSVERTIDFEVLSNELVPMQNQHEELSALFSYQLYRSRFLGQATPRFTDSSFAILPFTPKVLEESEYQKDEYWTVNTNLYESDLICSAATQAHPNGTEWDAPVVVTNSQKDCSYTFKRNVYPDAVVFDSAPYSSAFFGNGSVARKNGMYMDGDVMASALSLSNTEFSNCTRQNVMLAVWNKFPFYLDEKNDTLVQTGYFPSLRGDKARVTAMGNIPNNFSAVFCEPRYYERPVEAKINAATGSIKSTKFTGERTSISSAINSTFFEHLVTLGTQTPATPAFNVSEDHGQLDYNPFGVPDVSPILFQRPAFTKMSNMTSGNYTGSIIDVSFQNAHSMMGFAVADEKILDDFLDPEKFGAALTKEYKEFFAYAITSELSKAPDTETQVPSYISAQRTFKTEAYIMDPLWSRLLQATFIVLAVLEILVAVTLYGRRLDLHSDIGSIVAIMASISESLPLLSDFSGSEFVSLTETETKLLDGITRYSIRTLSDGGHRIDKVMVKDTSIRPLPHRPTIVDDDDKALIKPARPWELSTYTGAGAIICLLVLVGLFTSAFISDKRYRGLPNLSTVFVRNLVYSYLPTVAATSIETFLTALARFVCLTAPYEEMHRGPSPASKSVMADYERRSPHFLLLSAIRNAHYLLAGLIICIIAANALAIALGGIFLSGQTADLTWDATYTTIAQPVINASVYPSSAKMSLTWTTSPALYAGLSDANGKWEPPAWTDKEYYFTPFKLAEDSHNQKLPRKYATQTAETWGFGADFQCTARSEDEVSLIPDDANRGFVSILSKEILHVNAEDVCKGFSWNLTATMDDTKGPYDLVQRFVDFGGLYLQDMSALAKEKTCYDFIHASFVQYNIKEHNVTTENTRTRKRQVGLGALGPGAGMISSSSPERTSSGLTSVTIGTQRSQILATPSESKHIICRHSFLANKFSTTVSPTGAIVSRTRIRTPSGPLDNFIIPRLDDQDPKNNISATQSFLRSFLYDIKAGDFNGVRADSRPQEMIPFLLTQEDPELSQGLASSDGEAIARAMEKVLKRVFALYLQAYAPKLFEPTPDGASPGTKRINGEGSMRGTLVATTPRYKVSTVMTILAMILLVLFVLIVALTYWKRPGGFLPFVPTTLAATLPLLYASAGVEDVRGGSGREGLKERLMRDGGVRWGYGWFVGRDGESHVGVGKEPVLREWPQEGLGNVNHGGGGQMI
ncbi:hypothetical protein EDC01DRAFT_663782 [Geopyxis carbonaria]|nr:hypothetical protein EDC01DRAFT_663782 [Geopyxis carbonaria]